jgi:beta-lactam-binding protein with PASTA domain
MSCVVGAVPTIAGAAPITATYQGDTTHAESQGTASVCAGTTAQCTPNAQPPSTTTTTTTTTAIQTLWPHNPRCAVPKVTGKSLAAAVRLIKRAGCAIGKITRSKARKRQELQTLIVQRTTPAAGRRVSIGTKVAILLTQKRKPASNRE